MALLKCGEEYKR